MFHTIVIVLKRISCIIRRVNVDTFHCAFEVFFKRAKREKVITVDEHISRPRFTVREGAGFDIPKTIFRGVKEQTRLNSKRLILLANPRKLQFIWSI